MDGQEKDKQEAELSRLKQYLDNVMNDGLFNSLRVIYTVNALRIPRKYMERGFYDLPLDMRHIDRMTEMDESVQRLYIECYSGKVPLYNRLLKIYEYQDNVVYVWREYTRKMNPKRLTI